MKKKTILVAAIAVMLVAALVVGGGPRVLHPDTKSADNAFTMGNVAITLDETDVSNRMQAYHEGQHI